MTTDDLAEAQATEDALRAQLGELIGTRVRAQREAERLDKRARLPDADPSLARLAERHRAQAKRLQAEVDEARALLRTQEAKTEALRADAAGA